MGERGPWPCAEHFVHRLVPAQRHELPDEAAPSASACKYNMFAYSGIALRKRGRVENASMHACRSRSMHPNTYIIMCEREMGSP